MNTIEYFGNVRSINVRDEVEARARECRTGGSASVTMTGPRSDPPIPIFTTSVIAFPVHPRHCPPRTWSENSRM